MKDKLRVGDLVRRKGDTSGRTRAVKELYSGGNIVMLDGFLDSWLIWDIAKLELVTRAAPSQPNAKHTSERKA